MKLKLKPLHAENVSDPLINSSYKKKKAHSLIRWWSLEVDRSCLENWSQWGLWCYTGNLLAIAVVAKQHTSVSANTHWEVKKLCKDSRSEMYRLHWYKFHFSLMSSWWAFADKLVTSMKTTSDCGDLLVTKNHNELLIQLSHCDQFTRRQPTTVCQSVCKYRGHWAVTRSVWPRP